MSEHQPDKTRILIVFIIRARCEFPSRAAVVVDYAVLLISERMIRHARRDCWQVLVS